MKSIILFSGGIDSLLTWSILKEFSDPIALIIDYYQNEEEEIAATNLIKHYNIDHRYEYIPTLSQPDNKHETNYIPCRNAIMLMIAASHAIKEEASLIGLGINKDDYTDYVDCRLDFILTCEDLLRYYSKNLMINVPLLWLTKTEIIKKALDKNLALNLTWTCYTPVNGLSCGACNACKLRLKSFAELGQIDPIKYVQS
ncbi:MAG TPA: 7-cyano-7-deazaguanine synthase [Nitrosopumilaceae archaeon]|jgi:7-cyano-7-deazaguanine synthase|nr:7-cyano-7-deazaguanine synthase [Nitrosopumilaceae archaeon]